MAAGEGFEPPAQAPGAAPGLNLCEGPNPYERTMAKRKDPQLLLRVFLAAGEGFEPSHTESESAVLPLHNPAILCCPLCCVIQRTNVIIAGTFNLSIGNFQKVKFRENTFICFLALHPDGK